MQIIRIITFLSLCFTACQAKNIVIQNNSRYELDAIVMGDKWEPGQLVIAPYTQAVVALAVNNSGTVTLISNQTLDDKAKSLIATPEAQEITIGLTKQKSGFTVSQSTGMCKDNKPVNEVAFDKAQLTWQISNLGCVLVTTYNDGDTLGFIINPTIEAVKTDANSISVMSYNLFFLPYEALSKLGALGQKILELFLPDSIIEQTHIRDLKKLTTGQLQRAQRIPEHIAHLADVYAFQEGFDADARRELVNGMKRLGVPYSTSVLGRNIVASGGRFTNGGVFFMSRYPIVSVEKVFYQDLGLPSTDSDEKADKGFVYVVIEKQGRLTHIINTHTQSRNNKLGREIRAKQFAEIRKFIDKKKIPADQLVLITGDMNVTGERFPVEYQSMIGTLNVTHPAIVGYPYSVDPRKNDPGQILDYIFYDNQHLQPRESFNMIYKMFSRKPWKLGDELQWFLSDHFPVIGYFRY